MAFPGSLSVTYELDDGGGGVDYKYADGMFLSTSAVLDDSTQIKLWSRQDPPGYVFDHWELSGVTPTFIGTTRQRTLLSIRRDGDSMSGHCIATAFFVNSSSKRLHVQVLTSDKDRGLVSLDSGPFVESASGSFRNGDTVTISALAKPFYQFSQWDTSVGAGFTTATYTFNVAVVDMVFIAEFVPIVLGGWILRSESGDNPADTILRDSTNDLILRGI